jgi:hypothetical protein
MVTMGAAREVTATFDRRPVHPDTPGPEQNPDPVPTSESSPTPPTAKLIRVRVNRTRGTVTFAFKGAGDIRRFQCALAKAKQKPRFKRCTSPTTYRRLHPGKYTFRVRVIGTSGRRARPLVRKFEIAGQSTGPGSATGVHNSMYRPEHRRLPGSFPLRSGL